MCFSKERWHCQGKDIQGLCPECIDIYGTETLVNEVCKSAKSGEDRTHDGEMDLRGVAVGLEAQCAFVQSFGG